MTERAVQRRPSRRERQQLDDARLRNWLMFLVALGLTIHEGVTRGGDRPGLLVLYASMMGLPLVLGRSKTPTDEEAP